MLNLIRQHQSSWLIKTILWVIILAFVGTIFYSWGMGGATGTRSGVVATVDGQKISFSEYDRSFNNLVNFYRQQFRSQFSEDMIQRLDLKTQALDSLIQQKLLLREADNQDIRVSDAEVIANIKQSALFQKDNQFNETYYNNYLQSQRLSPLDFESSIRESLTLEKLENIIKNSTLVSKSEVMEAFKREEETVKLEYIAFAEDHFKSTEKASEENLKDYYEKNKIQFEVPDQIKVEYVKVTPKDLEAGIEPRDEDIQDYYESNLGKYRVQKKYRASHILFQLEPSKLEDATVEEKQKDSEETAKKEAEAALKKIREGEKFETLAEKISDDPASGDKGGSLGEFPVGTMAPEFEAELEKLEIGAISEPVKTPFGYHLIRLDEKIEERTKPLSEVKDTVVQAIKATKARQRSRRIVKRIHKSIEEGKDLAAAAAAQKVEVKTSGFFSRQNRNLPDIGTVPEFFNAAFILPDNKVSDPILTPNGSYLVKVVERKPAYIPEMDAVREKIEKKLAEDMDRKHTAKKFKELAEKLEKEPDLETIAKDNELYVQRTPYFSMEDSIPGIGDIAKIKDKAFLMDKGQTAAVSALRKHYLIKLADREEAGEPTEEQIKTITERLKREKGNIVFLDWFRNLREKSTIKIDKTLL